MQGKSQYPYNALQVCPTPGSHLPFWSHLLLFFPLAHSCFSLLVASLQLHWPPCYSLNTPSTLLPQDLCTYSSCSLNLPLPHIPIWLCFPVFAQLSMRLDTLPNTAINQPTSHAPFLAFSFPQHSTPSNVLCNLLILLAVSLPTLKWEVRENRNFHLFSSLWWSSHREQCVAYSWFSIKISWKTDSLTKWMGEYKKV